MREVRARRLAAGLGLIAALATVPAAPATSSSPDVAVRSGRYEEVMEIVGRQTESLNLDLGEKGISLGDQFIVAEDLYRDDKKVGDHSVLCNYVRINPKELQCVGTFALPEGQMTSQALLRLPAPPSVDVAITGGSGAYAGVRGHIRTVPAGETVRQFTFYIQR